MYTVFTNNTVNGCRQHPKYINETWDFWRINVTCDFDNLKLAI